MSVKKVCVFIGAVMAIGAITYAILKRENIKILMQKYGFCFEDEQEIEEG